MKTLHIINKLEKINELSAKLLIKQDTIILIEEAVYLLQKKNNILNSIIENHNIYALEDDITTRGVTNLISAIKIIDYDYFVDLTTRYEHILSWN